MEDKKIKSSRNWNKRFNLSNCYYSFFSSFALAIFCFFLCKFVQSPLKDALSFLKPTEDFNSFSDPFLSIYPYAFSSIIASVLLNIFSNFFSSGGNSDPDSGFISKFLKSNFYCLIRIFLSGFFSQVVKNFSSKKEKFYLVFLAYTFYFFSNYLTELIVVEIEKRGIFDGLSLIYFVNSFDSLIFYLLSNLNVFKWRSSSSWSFCLKNQRSIVLSFFLFFAFQLSVLMSNFRWEVPVETNSFYSPFKDKNNYFSGDINDNKPKFSLDFRLEPYSIMNFQYHLSFLFLFLNKFFTKLNFYFFNAVETNRYWWLPFAVWSISYLVYNYFVQSKKSSLELKNRGVYFDGIPFDSETKKFLFERTSQVFFVKQLILLVLVFIYNLINPNSKETCLEIVAFFSGLLHLFEQSKNYFNFMNFYG